MMGDDRETQLHVEAFADATGLVAELVAQLAAARAERAYRVAELAQGRTFREVAQLLGITPAQAGQLSFAHYCNVRDQKGD